MVPDEIWVEFTDSAEDMERSKVGAADVWVDETANAGVGAHYLLANPDLDALIAAALDTAAADCDRLDAMNAYARSRGAA